MRIIIKRVIAALLVGTASVFGNPQCTLEKNPSLSAEQMDAFRIAEEAKLTRATTNGLVKIAAAQVEIHTTNQVNVIIDYISQAGKDKADMIVFGEYLLGPFYNNTSEAVERVAKAAMENNVNVVVGGWEEFELGAYASKKKDAFANTALIFDRAGKIVGKYSKAHGAVGGAPYGWPPKDTDEEWIMKEGDGFPTFELDFGRVGIMICYDGYFAESAASLSFNGAEIILWLNGRANAVEECIVKTDMFRNYCAMIATNLGPGSGTMIGNWPFGIKAHVQETGNHYIIADIELEYLRLQRKNSRTFHQRRPEIYGALTEQHEPWKAYESLK